MLETLAFLRPISRLRFR